MERTGGSPGSCRGDSGLIWIRSDYLLCVLKRGIMEDSH